MPRPPSNRRVGALLLLALALLASFGQVRATTEPAQPESPKAGRTVRLFDSFDGQTFDRTVWHTSYRWHLHKSGSRNDGNDEEQWYLAANVRLVDGVLRLTAEKSDVLGERNGTPEWFAYRSGMIGSIINFRYGYIEAEARMPNDSGMWPALWLLPADLTWPPEIDIMEAGGRQGKVSQTVHLRSGAIRQHELLLSNPEDWHTYGLLWQPGELIWYVDGVETFRSIVGVPDVDMYVIANLAVGGEFSGGVDRSTRFPAAFEIRSLGVWQ